MNPRPGVFRAARLERACKKNGAGIAPAPAVYRDAVPQRGRLDPKNRAWLIAVRTVCS